MVDATCAGSRLGPNIVQILRLQSPEFLSPNLLNYFLTPRLNADRKFLQSPRH
jgi:hypothetical protein